MCFTPPSPGSRPPAPIISELSSDAAPALTTTPPVDIVNTLEILDTLSVVVFGCQYFMNEFQLIVPRKYAGTTILVHDFIRNPTMFHILITSKQITSAMKAS